MNMKNLGLTEKNVQESKQYRDLFIGRVSSQLKNIYKVITQNGEIKAEVSGKFHYKADDLAQFPAVGDFVMVDRMDNAEGNGIIHHVLERKSVFARKAAGKKEDLQIVAANIDMIFICMSLNNDFNLRRLERYLSIAWESGATPIIVLTKADLCMQIDKRLHEVASIAIGVDVHVTTSTSNESYQQINKYFTQGQTAAFIGSSGVGKSTLVNYLLGENIMDTSEIRSDDKGRHTTTRRELFLLPESGVVIDTPGMREIGIAGADLSKTFSDIDKLAAMCKFSDCKHKSEPGCAVQQAIQEGILTEERLVNYRKLQKEMKYEGLNSKMIEKEKLNEIFSEFGGMKSSRKYLKEMKKKKSR